MKYRIKKVTYVNDRGEVRYKYYPQHKHWWSGWHYYGSCGEYSCYDVFFTFEEAVNFIRVEIAKEKKFKDEYIYLDDKCNIVR